MNRAILALCCLTAQAVAQDEIGTSKTSVEITKAEWGTLSTRLVDPARRDHAIQRLDRFGPAIVARLTEALTGFRDPDRCRAILYALGHLAHHGAEHYDALHALRKDCPEPLLPKFLDVEADFISFLPGARTKHLKVEIRSAASRSMVSTGDDDRREEFGSLFYRLLHTVPAVDSGDDELLQFLLGKNDDRNAESAARILSRRGASAKPAVAALLQNLRRPVRIFRPTTHTSGIQVSYDAGARDRRWTALAIGRIDPGSEPAAEAWGYLALHGNSADLSLAVQELRRNPEAATPAVTHLTAVLEGKAKRKVSSTQQAEIVITLGILGSSAKSAIPTLENLVKGDDKRLVALAKAALRSLAKSK